MLNAIPKLKKSYLLFIIAGLILVFILIALFSRQEPVDLGLVNGSPDFGDESAVLTIDINGPFTVTYLGNDEKSGAFKMQVSTSSPQGREKALDWLREQGYNPTNLEIEFFDYINPLLPEVDYE